MDRRDKLPNFAAGRPVCPPRTPGSAADKEQYVAYNVSASIRAALYTGITQAEHTPLPYCNITNIVLKIEHNRATGRAYWFHYGNNNPQRTATLDSYGHCEDEMVKVDGKWLFSKRRIYNEQVERWASKGGNPAW